MSILSTPLALGAANYGGTEGPDFTRYLVLCGLLVLMVAGLGYGFRKLIGGALLRNAKARSLSVLDVLPMGGKKKLCVVRCYDRTFVLAQGDKEVTYVAELDSAAVPERQLPGAPIAETPEVSLPAADAELAPSAGRHEESELVRAIAAAHRMAEPPPPAAAHARREPEPSFDTSAFEAVLEQARERMRLAREERELEAQGVPAPGPTIQPLGSPARSAPPRTPRAVERRAELAQEQIARARRAQLEREGVRPLAQRPVPDQPNAGSGGSARPNFESLA